MAYESLLDFNCGIRDNDAIAIPTEMATPVIVPGLLPVSEHALCHYAPLDLPFSLVDVFPLVCPSSSNAAPSRAKSGEDTSRFVLYHIEALSYAQIEAWAADLGCLNRSRETGDNRSSKFAPEMARRCWDDTLHGHIQMVSQQAESGVFNATGRGIGLGLLADRHRATENWKDYPPAVSVSPSIMLNDQSKRERIFHEVYGSRVI